MPKVFISYSRKDEDFVRKLAKSLSEMKDISLWLDIDSIPTGMNWSTAIQQGLEACEMMLVIISPDSMNSRNVENEWQYFLDKAKRVIPVLCRPADLHFQLNRLQYIDFHSRGFDLAMSQLKEVLTSPEVKTGVPESPYLRQEGALAPKTILQGRYRIHAAVATGKFGTVVYQAYDLQFQEVDVVRSVAVKEINFHISDVEARQIAIRQFQREVNLLASLQHRAVPTVIDYFTSGNYAYLVTPYIQGYDLDSLLMMNADLLPVEKIIRWAGEIAEVLAYLHSRSPQPIILRDLKPSIIMIDQQESVWVVGFGVAKPFIPNIKGTMIGAEGYSPPELYQGSAYPASDVYSLGAVLHHLLTGQDPRLTPPFTFAERPIRYYNPQVSADLEAVVMKALEFEHRHRYRTGREMLVALQSLVTVNPSASASVFISEPAASIETVWAFKAEDEIRTTPVFHQNSIYVTCYDNNLYALDAATGGLRWLYCAEDAIATSPAICHEDNTVLFGSKDGCLYCIDASLGRLIWKYQTKAAIYSSPALGHEQVFFGCSDGAVYAVQAKTGRLAWHFETNDKAAVRGKVAVTEDRVLFGTQGGEFYCIDLKGQLKWRYKAKREIISAPLVMDEMVCFGCLSGEIHMVDLNSGWAAWRFTTGKPVAASPCAGQDVIYIGSTNGCMYALDLTRGRERWKFEADGQIVSSAVLETKSLYFGTTAGKLYCLDAETGKKRWQHEIEGGIIGSPLMAQSRLYVPSTDHHLYALQVG